MKLFAKFLFVQTIEQIDDWFDVIDNDKNTFFGQFFILPSAKYNLKWTKYVLSFSSPNL